MEELLKIDWTGNIEDIVDDKFVSEENVKNECVMYKILNSTFRDPFRDIRPPVRYENDCNNSTLVETNFDVEENDGKQMCNAKNKDPNNKINNQPTVKVKKGKGKGRSRPRKPKFVVS